MSAWLKGSMLLGGIALTVSLFAGELPRTVAPGEAQVYFISPADGETLSSPVNVRFGLKGMGIAPAGVQIPNTGHHHLVVNQQTPALDQPLGNDILHFGGGQTETTLELAPGEYTLQLILGDYLHIPHDPPIQSEVITITVE